MHHPPQFTVVSQSLDQTSTKFVLEPLPQGFGHTLGNSLRRILYSSISGNAITEVSIDNVPHQFTSIPGVKEDVIQLLLNLKQVRLTNSGAKPVSISLSAKGPGKVTASRFTTPPEVEIVNPDLEIADLADKNSRLSLTATVESGTGYSPAEERKSSTVGAIPLDAIFSPVVRVNYSVEATRVGRLTNYDKLILEIYTDGTLTPGSALNTAASILVAFFQAVVNPIAAGTPTPSSANLVAPGTNLGSSVSVEELDLPTRISNALIKAGFETVADLLKNPKIELAKVKNLGTKSVKIIELALRERGFELAP